MHSLKRRAAAVVLALAAVTSILGAIRALSRVDMARMVVALPLVEVVAVRGADAEPERTVR